MNKRYVIISLILLLTISIFILNSQYTGTYNLNKDELIGVKYKTNSNSSYIEWTNNNQFPSYSLNTIDTKCYDGYGNELTNSASNYIMYYTERTGTIELIVGKATSCNLYFDGSSSSSSGGGGEHCDGRKLLDSNGKWIGYCECNYENATTSSSCTAGSGYCAEDYNILKCPGKWEHGTGPCVDGPGGTFYDPDAPATCPPIDSDDKCYKEIKGLPQCGGFGYRYFNECEKDRSVGKLNPDSCS